MVRWLFLVSFCFVLAACDIPDPPPTNNPTLPAVLYITPAPTLDIEATATAYTLQIRPTPTPAGLYIVRDGDTLSGLAERYHTTVQEILVANGLTEPDVLQVGQELIIPSLIHPPWAKTPTLTTGITATETLSETLPPNF
jgi:LysM repeat protein